MKRMLVMVLGMGMLFGAIFGYHIYKSSKVNFLKEQNMHQAISVSVEDVKFEMWQSEVKTTGSVLAGEGVDIVPEVRGFIEKIHFKSGEYVQKGQILVELISHVERAQLESLNAQVELARITYKRDQEQLKIHALSQAQVDSDLYDLKNKEAQRDEKIALIAQKTIRAPFSGRLGVTSCGVGTYLNEGDFIVTLQNTDSLFVLFYLPQHMLRKIKVGQKFQIRFDGFKGKEFSGEVSSINPKIEEDTRNVLVEGTLESSKEQVLPGLFGEVTLYTQKPKSFLTLPQEALVFNSYGDSVFVAEETGVNEKGEKRYEAIEKFVTVGEKRDNKVAILKGLQEGERVVIKGQIKIKNKTPVEISGASAI